MTNPNPSRHVGDELPLYVAGQLAPTERAAIEAHLRECAACRRECAMWQLMPDAFATLNAVPKAQPTSSAAWNTFAARLNDTSPSPNGVHTMSSTIDMPPRAPAPSQTARTIRPNRWPAVAAVVLVIALMGGLLAFFKGHLPPSSVGTHPSTTATNTPTGFNLSGTWLGNGASDLNPNQQDCYRIDLTQAPGANTLTGSFGAFAGTCGTPYLPLHGTLHGSHLQLSSAVPSSAQAALTTGASAMQPTSSCGATTLDLTFHPSTTLSGTITNCSTVAITFTLVIGMAPTPPVSPTAAPSLCPTGYSTSYVTTIPGTNFKATNVYALLSLPPQTRFAESDALGGVRMKLFCSVGMTAAIQAFITSQLTQRGWHLKPSGDQNPPRCVKAANQFSQCWQNGAYALYLYIHTATDWSIVFEDPDYPA